MSIFAKNKEAGKSFEKEKMCAAQKAAIIESAFSNGLNTTTNLHRGQSGVIEGIGANAIYAITNNICCYL